MAFEIITWALFALSVAGNEFVVRKNRIGFLIWFGTNAGWVAINLHLGVYAAAAMFTVYLFHAARGWLLWGREPEPQASSPCVSCRPANELHILPLLVRIERNEPEFCNGCVFQQHDRYEQSCELGLGPITDPEDLMRPGPGCPGEGRHTYRRSLAPYADHFATKATDGP